MFYIYFLSVLLFIIILFLFLIFPAIKKNDDLQILSGLFIAHRGFHNNDEGIPENSLKAFQAAINSGMAIENDIHLTLDGEIVVFHDDSLLRMCGKDIRPEDMTLKEIKKCRLLNTDNQIPTLKETLELIDGKVPLLIEFKCVSLTKCKELCQAADEILKDYQGKYFIQSFYPFVLRWYRKNRKEIARGQLASSFKGEQIYKQMLGNMLLNFLGRPNFISYEHIHKNKIMRKIVRLLGCYQVGWTYHSKEEIEASKKDFSAYIFECFNPNNK